MNTKGKLNYGIELKRAAGENGVSVPEYLIQYRHRLANSIVLRRSGGFSGYVKEFILPLQTNATITVQQLLGASPSVLASKKRQDLPRFTHIYYKNGYTLGMREKALSYHEAWNFVESVGVTSGQYDLISGVISFSMTPEEILESYDELIKREFL